MAQPAHRLPPKPSARDGSPETTSIKHLLRLLDRMAKSVRTYGATNAVAVKFFTQFHQELTTHLDEYNNLGFVVQRSELYVGEDCVYATEESLGENLAFRLYSDGIRELRFHNGVTEEDLRGFLDCLWGAADGSDADDDFVTRMWVKDLTTITLVTAEEIVMSALEAQIFEPQETGFYKPPPESMKEIAAAEKAKGANLARAAARPSSGDTVGYELSVSEMARLAEEIQAETQTDQALYVLDMVKAILASEQSPILLGKALDLLAHSIDTLLDSGNWTTLLEVMAILRELDALSQTLTPAHKDTIAKILTSSLSDDRLGHVEAALNRKAEQSTEGLDEYLKQFTGDAIPAFCTLLGNLQHAEHRAVVAQTLTLLGKAQPEVLLKTLTDRRPHLVKAVLTILMKWQDPRYIDAIEKVIRYPDASVRREVLRAIGQLRPSGNANRIVALVTDEDELIRLNALKLLQSGAYTTQFEVWESLVTTESFADRPVGDRRGIYQAMRVSVGDGAVPYWRGLLADWGWLGRHRKEEQALMAVESLARLGTEAARAALEHGQLKGNTAVRQACAAALATPPRRAS